MEKLYQYRKLIIFISVSFLAFNMLKYTTSNTVYNKTISQDSVFNTFQLSDKNELISLVDNKEIKAVGYNSNILFITTNDNKRIRIEDIDSDIINYVKMNGIEPVELRLEFSVNSMNTDDTDDTDDIDDKSNIVSVIKEDSSNKELNTLAICLIVVVSIVLGMFISVSVLGKKSAQGKTQNEENNTCKNVSSYTPTMPEFDKSPRDSIIKTVDGTKIPKVKFSDVEGIDELKEDILRIVDCIKNPVKYSRAGARTPKGIILYGPPGTGKTLLAKAIAGEAGVPFIAGSGSDFVEKYVGVGAMRVRELYKQARKMAPCIVFIDEVDAVASKRNDSSNGEADQTINALLSELDGFGSQSNVVTICATNRLDLLDSAFTRAGRFDLKLAVGLPDKDSRLKILRLHLKNKKLDDKVSLRALSEKTVGFSGAELEALLNEAAMLAARNGGTVITQDYIDDAYFKIVMQGNKKKRQKIDEENKIIAWHEAGHTVATKLLTNDKVNSVTIIGSSSGAGGVTFKIPEKEGLQSRKYLRNSIAIMYAGRAAEEIYLGDDDLITTGASQDIKQATATIKQYIGLLGMGGMGLLDLTQIDTDFNSILNEATKLSIEIYQYVLGILESNKDLLKDIAEYLIEKETLREEDIDRIIKQHQLTMEVNV